MNVQQALKQTALGLHLTQAELDQLARLVVMRKLAKGELIFLEGDMAVGFYVLLKGGVRIYKASPEGREHTLHQIKPGQLFAEAAIFHGDRYPANCEAIQSSTVAFFPKEAFLRLIEKSPQISLKMIGSLAEFLRDFNQTIEMLSLKGVPARLASYLMNTSEQNRSATITLAMSKGELAGKLGTVSETLSRNLRKLSELQVIRVSGKQITILDPERLKSIAIGDKMQ